MVKPISINDFLLLNENIALADVRSIADFEHGHILGTVNLPLFTN